jgi:RimJ/RimL family protein N-acetyltransferase
VCSFFSPSGAGLITERLLLRLWPSHEVAAVLGGDRPAQWAEDFPAEGDRAVATFIDEHPDSLCEYGQRQIVERSTGLVVGSIGLFWPPADGAAEVGYGVVASRRNRGYALEATRALAGFALDSPEVHTVFAEVERSNPASVRVLEKAGWTPWGPSGSTGTVRLRTTVEQPPRC